MEKCPICADWCGPKSKEISRKKASKTAHELAEKEADIGIAVLEWEEVYAGMYYGTLQAELERIWSAGKVVIFDVDVIGGLKIKEKLQNTKSNYLNMSLKKNKTLEIFLKSIK
jgi:guanylate kinase